MASFDNLGYYEHTSILHGRDYLKKEILLSERTPNCLVVIDDVIGVTVVWVNDGDQNLIFVVCEGAEVSVITGCRVFIIELTKFCFVPCRVIKLFNFVMRFFAVAVALSARYMTVVVKIGPSAVLFVMVIQANFSFVLI